MSRSLLMCECHDAELGRFAMSSHGIVELNFETINCYYATEDPKTAEIRTCPGTLMLDGVTEVKCNMRVAHNEAMFVGDVVFDSHSAVGIDSYNLRLLDGVIVRRVDVLFTDGSAISITGSYAKLTLSEPSTFLELSEWDS